MEKLINIDEMVERMAKLEESKHIEPKEDDWADAMAEVEEKFMRYADSPRAEREKY